MPETCTENSKSSRQSSRTERTATESKDRFRWATPFAWQASSAQVRLISSARRSPGESLFRRRKVPRSTESQWGETTASHFELKTTLSNGGATPTPRSLARLLISRLR